MNWFLYNPTDIDIVGNTAIIGVNGTGKSTILDAIQAVLFGGDMNKIRFNAKASSKSQNKRGNLKRSLKSYCLGAYYTSDNGKEMKSLRQDSESYLALTFKSDNDDKVVNLFLAIEARFDEPKVDVRVLGLGRGNRALSCEDFIVRTNEKSCDPISIDQIRDALHLKGFVFKYCQTAKEYVSEMATLLGPDPATGESITPEVLSSTLSKSLSIGEIDSVSDFVKRFILEDRPLNVESVINARNYYQQILAQIREDENRLNQLKPIVKSMNKALKLKRKSLSLYWLYFEEKIGELDLLLEALQQKREQHVEEYLKNKEQTKDISEEALTLQGEIKRLSAEIANNDQMKAFNDLNREVKDAEGHKSLLIANRKSLFDNVESFINHEYADLLGADIDVSDLVALPSLLTEPETLNVNKVDKHLIDFHLIVASVKSVSKKKWLKLDPKKDVLTEQMQELYDQIESAKTGQVTLTKKTRLVIAELSRNNITAIPLCKLATISEPRWQKAIEAVLGGKTEALIVDPKDEVAAYRVYRQMRQEKGADIYNVNIVRTGKANDWLNRFKHGSAAEIVSSDNELALAYLHHQLGNFMLVDSEKELTQYPRAMTDDGMVSTAASTTRNKLPTTLKLIADQSMNIPTWEVEFKNLKDQRETTEDNAIKLNAIYDSSVTMSGFLEEFETLSFTNIKNQITKAEKDIDSKKEARDAIDLTSLEEKQHQLARITKEHADKSLQITQLAIKRGKLLTNSVDNKRKYIDVSKKQIPTLQELQNKLANGDDFDQQYTDDLSQQIEFEKPDDIQSQASDAENESGKAFTSAQTQLNAYLSNIDYFIDQDEDITLDNLDRVAMLLNNQYKHIEENSLAKHRETAEHAERQMNDAYRSDMINKLKAAFDEMFEQFRVINYSLRNNKFHNSTYAFRAYEKREFSDLIKYIKNASEEEANNVGDMFDNTPEEIKQDIDRLISGEAEGLSMIEDYREYFEYDVEITKLETGEKTKLSALGDFGSGGENQAPFYVTLASALSSAWRTFKKPGNSVGLTLLDEAFNNLSEDNLISAKEYMNKVGLQIIVAAPSDREPTFRTMVDTFVYISREGEAIDITVDYITDKGREVLMMNNPNLNPSLVEEKMAINE